MFRTHPSFVVAACLMAHTAAGDAGDDITNNLVSDLAPLLALFGERVTMQFMSQSVGMADNIILAMAPLGIITAIVAAIRVGGPSWLKAIIGRARESRAVAESELMSSTSSDVCELWNGQQIVRVMGSGPIREFIVLTPDNGGQNTTSAPAKDGQDVRVQVMELQDAENQDREYLKEYDPSLRERLTDKICQHGPDPERAGDTDRQVPENSDSSHPSIVVIRNTTAAAPNLILNVDNQVGRGDTYAVAVAGVFLQAGVLIYAGLATFYLGFLKDDDVILGYAFPCTLSGTVLLITGMALCSYVVESSTSEVRYRPGAGKKAHIIWLQRSGTVNDQTFESYAVMPQRSQALVTTSCRSKSQGNTIKEATAATGAIIGVVGFIAQFTGLRSMHWTVSAVQLGAIVIMTILRTLIRRNLAKSARETPLLPDHELDWLATTLGKPEGALWANKHNNPSPRVDHYDWKVTSVNDPEAYPRLAGDAQLRGKAQEVMEIRRGLGKVAGWLGPASVEAIALARSIEIAMDALFSHTIGDLSWAFTVGAEQVHFRATRDMMGSWKAYSDELDSALSLWLHSVNRKENREHSGKGETGIPSFPTAPNDDTWLRSKGTVSKPSLRLLGPYTKTLHRDLQWWLPDGAVGIIKVDNFKQPGSEKGKSEFNTEPNTQDELKNTDRVGRATLMGVEAHRVTGFASKSFSCFTSSGHVVRYLRQAPEDPPETATLAVESFSLLKTLYAQHMLSVFMLAAAGAKDCYMDGEADVTVRLTQRDFTGNDDSAWKSIALNNIRLSKMVQDMHTTGLGSLDEIYLAIVAPLSLRNKLPRLDAIIAWAREHARPHEKRGNWKGAADAYLWLFETAASFPQDDFFNNKATALLMEFLRAIMEATDSRKAQDFPKPETKCLEEIMATILKSLDQLQDKTFLARLMELYQLQGRSWECGLECLPIRDNSEAVDFTDMYHAINSNVPSTDSDILDWTLLHYQAVRAPIAYRSFSSLKDDPNARDIRGRAPLHYACQQDDKTPMQILINLGANVNVKDVDGMAPVHLAVIHGNLAVVRSLVDAGAEMDVTDNSGKSPLLWAAFKGHARIVKELWKYANMFRRDQNGRNILHLAVLGAKKQTSEAQSLTLVKQLLEERIGIHAKDRFERTALHIAASHGQQDIVKHLIDHGADPNAGSGACETPLHLAVESGDEGMIHLLLSKGANVNVGGRDDEGPLCSAIAEGREDIVKLLLERMGADVNAMSRQHRTPVHKAIESNQKGILKILLEHGAQQSWKAENSTALIEATKDENISLIQIVLEYGADTEGKGTEHLDDGMTALHIAIMHKRMDIVKLLLQHGASTASQNESGETPLHLAVEYGSEDMVKLVLQYGGYRNVKDKRGMTPLDAAANMIDMCGDNVEWLADLRQECANIVELVKQSASG